MNYKLYEVGGKVRDELLGFKSKDIDYSVVIERTNDTSDDTLEVFNAFVEQIKSEGFKVFKKESECLTVRAKFPPDHPHSGIDADFVIARKELGYVKGTRTPIVTLGELYDDLVRRDFTVNAMAKDIDGNIIDLFNGFHDMRAGLLKTPTDAALSFNDDPLRILRGLRFAVTKGFSFSDEVVDAIKGFDYNKMGVVSLERIYEELKKMFLFDTVKSFSYIQLLKEWNSGLYHEIMDTGIKFEPTIKKKHGKQLQKNN